LRNGDYTCTVINSIIEDMEKNKWNMIIL
jgi:hypothetical protein